MRKRVVKHIIFTVAFSAIPALLSYLANSSLLFDKLLQNGLLGKKVDIKLIQDYCLWLGIIISAIALSSNLFITKLKYDSILEQRNALIKMNKTILASSLGKRFLSDSSSFDIRIFIPKYPSVYNLVDKLQDRHKKIKKPLIRKIFVIKNIDLIAEQGITKNLQFEVFPKQEGLVGLCYNTKSMVYDDDLESTNDKNYKLRKNQIDRTSNLKWSICCPISDDNGTVVAILALDGKTKIKINKAKEATLREEVVAFNHMLYDSVPQLFKR